MKKILIPFACAGVFSICYAVGMQIAITFDPFSTMHPTFNDKAMASSTIAFAKQTGTITRH